MVRGLNLFKCTNCGKRFIALDIEWQATALSMPQKCSRCGSIRTRPAKLFGWSDGSFLATCNSLSSRYFSGKF